MLSHLIALGLTYVVVRFCMGAMTLRSKPEDTDIDAILEAAERPYYEKSA